MKKAFYVLADFEENLKITKGKNYVAKCPKCEKWNLYISKTTGLYNCFTGGCDFKGILQDFCEQKPMKDDAASGTFYPKNRKIRFAASRAVQHPPGPLHKGDGEVRMLPTDYKRLSPVTVAAIKPVTDASETTDLDEKAAWEYLADMGISRQTAHHRGRKGCTELAGSGLSTCHQCAQRGFVRTGQGFRGFRVVAGTGE